MTNRKLTAKEVIIALMMLGNKEVMKLLGAYNHARNPIIQHDATDFSSEDLSVEEIDSIKKRIDQILGQGENN
jgi:hypothetical protein